MVGTGFADIDTGLRLRYEFSRKFAPYLGVVYEGKFGQTANFARRAGESTVRVRSIEAHAAGITAPPWLDDPAKVLMGIEHFAAHCAVCHGAPGVPKGDIAQGLYPNRRISPLPPRPIATANCSGSSSTASR